MENAEFAVTYLENDGLVDWYEQATYAVDQVYN